MVTAMKPSATYIQQVELLTSRGMDVGDPDSAMEQLQRVSYYRLSGYWYPFRKHNGKGRLDEFHSGTNLADVVKLYTFDANLRSMTFAALTPIELAVRAQLGHALGEVDTCAHLNEAKLGSRARGGEYTRWLERYRTTLADSREDFVAHHTSKYNGTLPVWAAVEVLDWGGLTRLYGFSPRGVQDRVASAFGLTSPQFESWMKSLNIIRNICGHHGRLFNRVFAITPKLPAVGRYPDLDSAGPFSRTFGQLTMIQFMLDAQDIGRKSVLPTLLRAFPAAQGVSLKDVGVPDGWENSSLWPSL